MNQLSILSVFVVCVLGCSDDSAAPEAPSTPDETPTSEATPPEPTRVQGLQASDFAEGALVSHAIEPCKLSGGTEVQCHRITVLPRPTDHAVGPFCPRRASDGPDESGKWFVEGSLQDADGAFLRSLPELYEDDTWDLFDGDAVRVTDTQEACEAAARPDVDERYQNYCVECDLAYYEATPVTYWLPVQPVDSAQPTQTRRGSVGVALNGVTYDPPAPVDAILGAHTLAPLDDCGGHVNPHAGYHYHAATGCSTSVAQEDGHPALLGFAMDGYAIYAGDDVSELDECGGHTDALRGYHYHVGPAGGNQVLGCLRGETGCSASGADSDQTCNATQTRRGPPGGGPPGGGPPGSGPPPDMSNHARD